LKTIELKTRLFSIGYDNYSKVISDSWYRTAGEHSQDSTARIGKGEQDSQKITART
jgi:hypothetical protein